MVDALALARGGDHHRLQLLTGGRRLRISAARGRFGSGSRPGDRLGQQDRPGPHRLPARVGWLDHDGAFVRTAHAQAAAGEQPLERLVRRVAAPQGRRLSTGHEGGGDQKVLAGPSRNGAQGVDQRSRPDVELEGGRFRLRRCGGDQGRKGHASRKGAASAGAEQGFPPPMLRSFGTPVLFDDSGRNSPI